MAKKKINIKSVTADVPSGDVNITYNNVRIAGLSETVEATLETEDTICEHDIVVDYTKSSGSDIFEIVFTVAGDSTVTASKTFAELSAAIAENKVIIAKECYIEQGVYTTLNVAYIVTNNTLENLTGTIFTITRFGCSATNYEYNSQGITVTTEGYPNS